LPSKIPSKPSRPKAEAKPTTAIQAVATPAYAVPEQVRALLGPSWLIEGEDPKLYDELLGRVGAAVQPTDIIDWLLLKDIVAITWEIQRSRRQRETVVRMGRLKAIEQILEQVVPPAGMMGRIERNDDISRLASEWLNGDAKANRRVLALIAGAGFSPNDVIAHTLTVQAKELGRIDDQTQRHESRRDAMLQQIERRREGFAQRVRRASEDAVDAEFVEAPSTAVALAADGAGDGKV
jgi:hypothetical protein